MPLPGQGDEALAPTHTPDDALQQLARAGDHPIVASFPHGALFAFDGDLRYLAAGGSGLGDVGLSRDGLEGHTIFEVFPPETCEAIEPLYRAALAGESTSFDVPYAGRIYTQRLAPVRDGSGTVVAGLGFTQDVTDARASEQALRESEERARLTFTYAPIGKALVELDGRWRAVNSALTSLLGYTEDELLAMTFQDITHPDDLDLDLEHLGRLVAGEISSYEIEKRYFTASGTTVWVLLSVTLVRDEVGAPRYFISQIQDITERKRQQDALQDLIAMLAHDLRTPTTVITGFTDLLLQSWDSQTDQERRRVLQRIGLAAHTLQSLLENSLTVSSLDAHGMQARPRQVRVDQAVRDVLATIPDPGLDVDVSGLAPATAWVDAGHLTQVVSNLLTNAMKYGGDALRLTTTPGEGTVLLVVADNGPGVPPEFVPHLFDRFSRSDETRSGDQRGSGLGLYIVRDLMALNHATVGYDDTPGGGATFTVELPAEAPQAT